MPSRAQVVVAMMKRDTCPGGSGFLHRDTSPVLGGCDGLFVARKWALPKTSSRQLNHPDCGVTLSCPHHPSAAASWTPRWLQFSNVFRKPLPHLLLPSPPAHPLPSFSFFPPPIPFLHHHHSPSTPLQASAPKPHCQCPPFLCSPRAVSRSLQRTGCPGFSLRESKFPVATGTRYTRVPQWGAGSCFQGLASSQPDSVEQRAASVPPKEFS